MARPVGPLQQRSDRDRPFRCVDVQMTEMKTGALTAIAALGGLKIHLLQRR